MPKILIQKPSWSSFKEKVKRLACVKLSEIPRLKKTTRVNENHCQSML
ncbi:hypothetical protein SZ54_3555 [Rhizobium sp. UR51a]|nr:hypothetical protein SZ54_3555 [Rhizobium sp. UR51a]